MEFRIASSLIMGQTSIPMNSEPSARLRAHESTMLQSLTPVEWTGRTSKWFNSQRAETLTDALSQARGWCMGRRTSVSTLGIKDHT